MLRNIVRGIALCSALACGSPIVAQPSAREPELLLAPARSAAKELLLEADVLLRETTEATATYETKLQNGDLKTADARLVADIGLTYVTIGRLARIAEQLILAAEPAGVDLAKRTADLDERMVFVINQYGKLPNATQILNARAAVVNREATAKAKSLTAIGTIFKQGNVEQAKKRLDESVYDELGATLCWYPHDYRAKVLLPFSIAKKLIDDKAVELRRAATTESLAQLRAENDPKLNELSTRIAAAIKSVEASGAAEWDGASLSGPQLLLAWSTAWRAALVKTLRCRAIDAARGIKNGTRPPSELDELDAAYAKFDEALVAGAGQLISADAARTTPADAPALYLGYLDSLATITPQVASPNWLSTIEAALATLRDKSPELAQQVKSYQQATDDLLRWRQRAALAAARGRMKAVKDLDLLWREAGIREAMVERKGPSARPELTYLITAAPPLVRDVARVSLEQNAWTNHFAPAADGSATSRYRNRVAARLAQAKIPEAEIAKLRSDLLVTDSQPPLSLAAALAIKSAEEGRLVAAGGKVAGVELQSLLAHFFNLPESAPHIALGPLPTDAPVDNPGTPVEQMTYWFDIAPQWLQHEYIFVEIP